MDRVRVTLIRGICQLPAYVAHEKSLFRELGLSTEIEVVATASQIPDRLVRRDSDFAILPWTRVVLSRSQGKPLVLLCGSGHEEAAIVVRAGLRVEDVRTVALPQRGGLKDLTAIALFESLGWGDVEELRLPSGDAAVLALVTGGADAVSTVEPFATAIEGLGFGTVVRRTGDVWPGAPGCSLATSAAVVDREPDVVRRVVEGFVRGLEFVEREPDDASEIGSHYIGVPGSFVREALRRSSPHADTLHNRKATDAMLSLMIGAGYLDRMPDGCADLSFLEAVRAERKRARPSAASSR